MELAKLKNGDSFIFLQSIQESLKTSEPLIIYKKVAVFLNEGENSIIGYMTANSSVVQCADPNTDVSKVIL
jgi:hypothetical protein